MGQARPTMTWETTTVTTKGMDREANDHDALAWFPRPRQRGFISSPCLLDSSARNPAAPSRPPVPFPSWIVRVCTSYMGSGGGLACEGPLMADEPRPGSMDRRGSPTKIASWPAATRVAAHAMAGRAGTPQRVK